MSGVVVEFPIEEAEGLLKRLGIDSMSAAECDAAQAGRERLERAVKIERGPGGSAHNPSIREQVEDLIGQKATVYSLRGTKVGIIDEISAETLVHVRQHGATAFVPLGSITGVKAEEQLEAAA